MAPVSFEVFARFLWVSGAGREVLHKVPVLMERSAPSVVVNWVMTQALLLLFILGSRGASVLAIPLGGMLFWCLMLVSGRGDKWLSPPIRQFSGYAVLKFIAASVVRSLALAACDFELGRALEWIIDLAAP
jgi:hypothetical protein